VRSTERHVVKCLGLKWVSMMLLELPTVGLAVLDLGGAIESGE
jgi:hypothetical protein